MTTKTQLALLADVSRLLTRHGAEAFFSLSNLLTDPDFCNRLSTIMDALGKKATLKRNVSIGPVSDKLLHLRASLAEIEKQEPEKSKILMSLLSAMIDRSVLPTLKDIRFFGEDNGLSPLSAKSRSEGVMQLVRQLEGMTIEDIKKLISRIHPVPISGGGSLEGWSNIIMRRGEQKKDPGNLPK